MAFSVICCHAVVGIIKRGRAMWFHRVAHVAFICLIDEWCRGAINRMSVHKLPMQENSEGGRGISKLTRSHFRGDYYICYCFQVKYLVFSEVGEGVKDVQPSPIYPPLSPPAAAVFQSFYRLFLFPSMPTQPENWM